MTWPTEKSRKIKEMWDEGYLVKEIATALFVSQDAAYNKIKRLKLKARYPRKNNSCA